MGWFVVRCLRPDSKYIQNKFVGLQNDIEREVRSLKTSKTTEAPAETFDHPDVEMPTYLPCNMEVISAEGVSDAASSIGHGNGQEISLMVPDSLREFPLVVAWQDLQPRDRVFDPDFISLAAQTKIEQVYKVAIVADEGQKVIFIGGSDAAALRSIKAKLTTLLRDFLASTQESPLVLPPADIGTELGAAHFLPAPYILRLSARAWQVGRRGQGHYESPPRHSQIHNT